MRIDAATLLVCMVALIVGVSYGMHSPIVPIFAKQDMSADYSSIGIIGTVNYLPYMFAPFFVGILLDRFNKARVLVIGIVINIFAIYLLSFTHQLNEILLLRFISGISHSLFWPSSEALIATNSSKNNRIKGISLFTSAWVAGFMVGPLLGKLILGLFDYRTLFEFASICISFALIPSFLLYRYGSPSALNLGISIANVANAIRLSLKEVAGYSKINSVLLYYAITFGIVLAVYPAFMKSSFQTDQNIELLYFIFGASRFVTLFLVPRLSQFGELSLGIAVASTATAMFISFISSGFVQFAVALVLTGFAISVFYPITISMITSRVPRDHMGKVLGAYEAIFGIGWTAGPISAGMLSDVFGVRFPYLVYFVVGFGLAAIIIIAKYGRR